MFRKKKVLKTFIKISAVILGTGFAVLSIIAKVKKKSSVYMDVPDQKNPLEGKKVRFIENENEPENADGVKGHLEAVGTTDYTLGFYDKYVKRVIDITLSFCGLVVLSPVFAAIALAIKIEDPGPVLFTQKRLGKNKQYFKLHKFRSMKVSTPHDVPTHMLENPEQYITKVGKFIRKHSLDELPQIWDIFIGNMSIIGPRPGLWNQDVLTAERDKYGANDVRPGLTGWAQINGRDELEIPEKARLDGEYVQNMGLAMDIKCFLGSVHVFGKDESVVEGGTGEMKQRDSQGRHYTDGKTDEELIGHIGFGEPVIVDPTLKRKVLITGKGSYIGESFQKYAEEHYPSLEIDSVDMLDPSWRQTDFSLYDIVYHVAGIAHADVGKVDAKTKEKYYEVNTDLAVEVCKKAKMDGVKEFIFMSSMLVYGNSAPYGKSKVIDEHTIPKVANFYGDSKLQADVAVRDLADERFKVIVLRPPMIYGEGSKGNYSTLSKLAKKMLIFPDVKNQRSMLFIDNLCELLCQAMLVRKIKSNAIVLFPQNGEVVSTSEMVKAIARINGNNIHNLKVMVPVISLGSIIPGKIGRLVHKAFGNMTYDQRISTYPVLEYRSVGFEKSIEKSECVDESQKSKALMLASVASMIDLFNMDNISILQNLGYNVDVAANFEFGSITSQKRVDDFKEELLSKKIGVYHVPIPRNLFRVKEIIQSYWIIKKLVEKKKYRIVHCHSPIGGVVCRLACRNSRKKYGTKVLYTAHGFHFFKGASKKAWIFFYSIEKFCSFFTDILITINQEDYQNACKFHAKRVEYIPGIGVHTKEFRNVKINRNEKRAELHFSGDDFVFMSTGQLSVRKNHEVIIRSLDKIHNPKVKYLVVGFGELENSLKILVNELGLNNRVVFAGYRSDVKELLHAVDAYVFPSLQEGLPVSLMEAMAVGLPVVCSKIRGNVDLIENNQGGYLYDCHDIDGFAKGMKKIIEEDNIKMGSINIETMKKFDISVVNRKMKKIYNEVYV